MVFPCRAFVENVSSKDKLFLPVDGGFHEVMFEENGPVLVQGMIDWILARAPGVAPVLIAEAKM